MSEASPEESGTVALLEVSGVNVHFGGVRALVDVDMVVPGSAITGLVGPNGAGKTTLFGVLSGLLRPDSGRIVMDGDDVTFASPQARARRGLSRTFQRPHLFGDLTVREHLALAHRVAQRPARFWGGFWRDAVGLGRRSGSEEEEATIARIASMLELDSLLDTPAAGLGLGTARLVEVARALARRPRLVLLDEPSSGLDSLETEQLARVLAALNRDEGLAFLLVEHDLELVMALSREVHVLDFGRMIAKGPPDLVRADPAVQAAYIGTAL